MTDPKISFEKFEKRQTIRAVVVFAGGGIAIALLRDWVTQLAIAWGNGALLVAILVWAPASYWAVSRMRHKDETIPAYKRRVRYPQE